jgi:hypothetical protein
MRVAVIRGDLPSSLFLSDLEPSSQVNRMYETEGQTRYVSRITPAKLDPVMTESVPASVASTGNLTFPLIINAGNQTLKIKHLALDAYTTVLIPTTTYNNMTDLVAAINGVLILTTFRAAISSAGALRLALQSTVGGTGDRIQIDSTAGGSTFNTPGVLAAGGSNFTVPTSSAVILALVPVGGPVDVSAATVRTNLGAGLTSTQLSSVQDALAPRFIDTDVSIKSFLVGNLSKYRSASFNPDSNRIPAIANGAAVVVLADDGVTAFTANQPTLTNAQFGVPVAGAVTLTGLGLSGSGSPSSEVVATKVKFLLPSPRTVDQAVITDAGGVVSATSIVIPASKVPAGVAAGTQVQVFYTSFASNIFTLV